MAVQYFVRRRGGLPRQAGVVIAGGGDSAVDWALSLKDVATKTYVVHRRPKFRAAPDTAAQLDAAAARGEIELVIPYQLHALYGADGTLASVEVAHLDGTTRQLEADRLLPFFGLSMDLGPIAHWGLALERRHIQVNPATCETSVPGVVRDRRRGDLSGQVETHPAGLQRSRDGSPRDASAGAPGRGAAFRVFDQQGRTRLGQPRGPSMPIPRISGLPFKCHSAACICPA